MMMSPAARKFALTAHVASSVGWLGAAVAYLALAAGTLASNDDQVVRAAYLAMKPIGWFALVPLAGASLLTGLVSSLGTQWGLFRHYWVIFKLMLSVVATIVLLGNMQTVELLADGAAGSGMAGREGLRSQVLHSAGGAVVLLVATALAVYKPKGMTRHGWRRLHTP